MAAAVHCILVQDCNLSIVYILRHYSSCLFAKDHKNVRAVTSFLKFMQF